VKRFTLRITAVWLVAAALFPVLIPSAEVLALEAAWLLPAAAAWAAGRQSARPDYRRINQAERELGWPLTRPENRRSK
jgi:hypothetical protein